MVEKSKRNFLLDGEKDFEKRTINYRNEGSTWPVEGFAGKKRITGCIRV